MPERKKPGPAPRGNGPIKRRSISMSDAHWDYLRQTANELGVSASSMVCEWIDQRLLDDEEDFTYPPRKKEVVG